MYKGIRTAKSVIIRRIRKMKNKKNVVAKIVDGLVQSTKTQHEITKAVHELNKVSPSDAKEMFWEQYAEAKKPPLQKQLEQLAEIQAKVAAKRAKKAARTV